MFAIRLLQLARSHAERGGGSSYEIPYLIHNQRMQRTAPRCHASWFVLSSPPLILRVLSLPFRCNAVPAFL